MHCEGITINGNGLVLDAPTPNYAQGTVVATSVPTDRLSFAAEFDADFLTPDCQCDPFSRPGAPLGAHVVLWDPSSRTMLPTWSSTPMVSSELVRDTTWRITLANNTRNTPAPVGALVTVFPRRGFTFSMVNCSRMQTVNVTLYAGGNEGFTECFGDGGNMYSSVRVTRRPGSKGLLSINADGFNVDSVGRGPTIVNSEVGFNGDDSISVHDRMQVVCNYTGQNEILVMDLGQGQYEWAKWSSAFHNLRSGDLLEFYDMVALSKLGQAMVITSQDMSANESAVQTCGAAYRLMQALSSKPVVEPFVSPSLFAVRFPVGSLPSSVVDAKKPVMVSFPRRSSTGAVIRGNHFHDGAQRMAIIGASDLVLDANVFERSLNGGLHVESEEWALEGAIVIANVSITNNVVVGNHEAGVDVMKSAVNITCHNNTWVVGQTRTTLQHC